MLLDIDGERQVLQWFIIDWTQMLGVKIPLCNGKRCTHYCQSGLIS